MAVRTAGTQVVTGSNRGQYSLDNLLGVRQPHGESTAFGGETTTLWRCFIRIMSIDLINQQMRLVWRLTESPMQVKEKSIAGEPR